MKLMEKIFKAYQVLAGKETPVEKEDKNLEIKIKNLESKVDRQNARISKLLVLSESFMDESNINRTMLEEILFLSESNSTEEKSANAQAKQISVQIEPEYKLN